MSDLKNFERISFGMLSVDETDFHISIRLDILRLILESSFPHQLIRYLNEIPFDEKTLKHTCQRSIESQKSQEGFGFHESTRLDKEVASHSAQ